MTRRKNAAGILSVLLGYILWGVLPIFWKQLSSLPALYTLSARIVWATVFCFALAIVMGQAKAMRAALRDRAETLRLLLAGAALALNWGLYIYAVNESRVLDASLAYYLDPLLTILVARLLYGERLRRAQWCAIALMAAGLILSAAISGKIPYLAVGMALSFTAYGAITKRCSTPAPASTMLQIGYLAPFAAAFMVLSSHQGGGVAEALNGAWVLLPLSGVLTAMPLFFFSVGVRRVPLNVAGILKFINPTLQMLVSVCLYSERFGAVQAIPFACAWIALAIYLVSGAHRQKAAHAAV